MAIDDTYVRRPTDTQSPGMRGIDRKVERRGFIRPATLPVGLDTPLRPSTVTYDLRKAAIEGQRAVFTSSPTQKMTAPVISLRRPARRNDLPPRDHAADQFYLFDQLGLGQIQCASKHAPTCDETQDNALSNNEILSCDIDNDRRVSRLKRPSSDSGDGLGSSAVFQGRLPA